MKHFTKIAATLLLVGGMTEFAHAAPYSSQTVKKVEAQSTATTTTTVKSKRRVVREAVPTKITPKSAANLYSNDKGYGKVLVPVKSNSRTPNYFRPSK